jgi:hypothetical protein
VRVTSPAGTDIRFTVGDRPFNKQDGDASKGAHGPREGARRSGESSCRPARGARGAHRDVGQRRHRRPEGPPAGGRRGDGHPPRVHQREGRQGHRAEGQKDLDAYLASSPALTSFRELGLGFNPKLAASKDAAFLPYYGYGDAVVRLALGDNTEVGGAVRGGRLALAVLRRHHDRRRRDRIVENGRLTAAYR